MFFRSTTCEIFSTHVTVSTFSLWKSHLEHCVVSYVENISMKTKRSPNTFQKSTCFFLLRLRVWLKTCWSADRQSWWKFLTNLMQVPAAVPPVQEDDLHPGHQLRRVQGVLHRGCLWLGKGREQRTSPSVTPLNSLRSRHHELQHDRLLLAATRRGSAATRSSEGRDVHTLQLQPGDCGQGNVQLSCAQPWLLCRQEFATHGTANFKVLWTDHIWLEMEGLVLYASPRSEQMHCCNMAWAVLSWTRECADVMCSTLAAVQASVWHALHRKKSQQLLWIDDTWLEMEGRVL